MRMAIRRASNAHRRVAASRRRGTPRFRQVVHMIGGSPHRICLHDMHRFYGYLSRVALPTL
jgi:hypothetical protein